MGFEWFSKGITDLDSDAQKDIFQKEILRLDPATLPMKGRYVNQPTSLRKRSWRREVLN